ncbi:chemerin-like receptor 1 [Diretmus argenteus]
MDTITLTLYCFICIVGTVGNSLVIYVTGFRMKKTVNSIWYLNLSLADFLFTVFLIFSIIYVSKGYTWPFGDVMCKISSLVNSINMFASIFLLMAISLDRFLSTWVVVWAQNKRTPRKAEIICLVIWLAALACSMPFTIFRVVIEINGRYLCVYSRLMDKRSLTIFRFVLGFLVPFLVITLSYIAIGVRTGRLQKKRKRKSFRIIIVIILAFFLCWLPFHVFQFIELSVGRNKSLRGVMRIGGPLSINLAFLNSCLNPILYVFMCDEFQKKLQQSVCAVFEHALAEDHLSFGSSRTLSSQLSRITRKSDSAPPPERNSTTTSLTTNTDNQVVFIEERETLNNAQDLDTWQPM